MKKPLFNKMTALAMGSLMVFSGQALAIKSNNQKIIDAEALNNLEIVIAQQDTGRACAQVKFGVAKLDQIITALEQVKQLGIQQLKEIPPEVRAQIVNHLKEAIKALVEAKEIVEEDENSELVIAITTVIAILDQVAGDIASGAGEVSQVVEVLKGVKADAERACQFQ